MRARAAVYAIAFVLIAAFAIANWPALTTPVEVNFLITRAFVPGAVLMLVLLGLIALIDWTVHAVHHSEWRRQRRVMEAEIQRLRIDAGKEGDVRYDNLRTLIERESARIHERLDTFAAAAREPVVRTVPVVHETPVVRETAVVRERLVRDPLPPDPELAVKRPLKH